MKNLLLYGMGLMFSFAISTAAFAGNDGTTAAKQGATCTSKKACTGKCNGKCTGKCTGKAACTKPASKS